MTVRFVSSLTPDDEARVAPMLIKLCEVVLDQFPIVYNIRIETSGDVVFQHSNTTTETVGVPVRR